jgi:hypothetical protein
MAVTYTWSIVQIDALPERDGKQNVVSVVHWALRGQENGLSGSTQGAHAITFKGDGTFTPYANLSESQIIGWVKDTMGADMVAAVEADVAQQISNKANAPVATALPWA